jgi:hypothetical protein
MNRLHIVLTTVAVVLVAACQPIAAQVPTPPVAPSAPAPSIVPEPSSAVDPSPLPSSPPPVVQSPAPSTGPSAPTPPPADVPPAPSGVKMTVVESNLVEEGYYADLTTTIRWSAPKAAGTEIRVYGVTTCFAPAAGGPCLVEHTPLPDSVRDLIATAPASAGKVSWTWPSWDDVGGAVMGHGDTLYQAIVIAAYGPAGHSKFIIVRSGEWCPDCTY